MDFKNIHLCVVTLFGLEMAGFNMFFLRFPSKAISV